VALLRGLVDLLYPPACQVCRSPGQYPLCPRCAERFPLIKPPFCQKCGKPLHGPPDLLFTCIPCRRRRWGFARARSVGVYDGTLRDAIHALKFRRCADMAVPLGTLLAELIAADQELQPDVIVPVPLHPVRLRERGFNQSALLAAQAGRYLERSVDVDTIRRTRPTASQTGLPASERRSNVRGAFVAAPGLPARRVLLIDDVMSTGSTARECARVLRRAGAGEVVVATLAIAVLR
jgi:ComF family protein